MDTTTNTSVTGAALGASTGCVIAWIAETAMKMDIPSPVEGAIVVIATALVALVYPASPRS